jgi:hypothetical protein
VIDTSDVTLAVDVGGATGSLLELLQHANPTLRRIVFDRPNIVDDAVAQIARNGLAERTEVIGGDFFQAVPAADTGFCSKRPGTAGPGSKSHDPVVVMSSSTTHWATPTG